MAGAAAAAVLDLRALLLLLHKHQQGKHVLADSIHRHVISAKQGRSERKGCAH